MNSLPHLKRWGLLAANGLNYLYPQQSYLDKAAKLILNSSLDLALLRLEQNLAHFLDNAIGEFIQRQDLIG